MDILIGRKLQPQLFPYAMPASIWLATPLPLGGLTRKEADGEEQDFLHTVPRHAKGVGHVLDF